MMVNGAIAFEYSLAPLPWHLRVNLDVEVTSVLVHPRQREELKVMERCYKPHITGSVACR